MSHSIQPLSWLNRISFASRKWPLANQIGRFFRRTVWAALVQGFWEFTRALFRDFPNWGPPGRTFSLYHALRWGDPAVRGRIILEDQGSPSVRSDSLVVQCGLNQHLEQPWPIVWTEHDNARLVSNSLALLNEEKKLCLESVYGEAYWRDDPASRTLWLPKPTYLKGRWTSIVSNWNPLDGSPVYGHWLHDALPRLAILADLPKDTRILVPKKLKAIHWETLELLGLKDRCRPTSEIHLEIEKYFFSSPVGMISCFNPHGTSFMRRSFFPKAAPDFNGPKKFFFLRTSSHRRLANMDEIVNLLKERGWPIVRDVDLSFAQTVALFSQATDICSFLGSNMSNTMFCSSECKVLQWVPDIFLDGFTDMIASVVGFELKSFILRCGGPTAHSPVINLGEIRQSLADAGYLS